MLLNDIGCKVGSMPVIIGGPGSGKSIIAEIFGYLMEVWASTNVDDLNKVFSKFTKQLTEKLVFVINEPPEAAERFSFTGKIKAGITQKSLNVESKGIDQHDAESSANYLMTTNNYNPIQEEGGDRRIIYFETSNKQIGNKNILLS
jgi:phage/plasmid-associated DNA primase